MDVGSVITASMISATYAAWIGVWLVKRRGLAEPADKLRPLLVPCHHAIAALPFVWLLMVATLVLRGYIAIGAWPHGGDWVDLRTGWIEPNIDARAFGLHYWIVTALGLALLLSWMAFVPLHALLYRSRSWKWMVVTLVGFVAFSFVTFNADPWDVMEWLDG